MNSGGETLRRSLTGPKRAGFLAQRASTTSTASPPASPPIARRTLAPVETTSARPRTERFRPNLGGSISPRPSPRSPREAGVAPGAVKSDIDKIPPYMRDNGFHSAATGRSRGAGRYSRPTRLTGRAIRGECRVPACCVGRQGGRQAGLARSGQPPKRRERPICTTGSTRQTGNACAGNHSGVHAPRRWTPCESFPVPFR